ncbi:phosphotransferase [Promicromonospora panici]|uniref:phosphotransferase n=1 Tax=Promicromonospora panici TaxID=2219658 RepID=UPI00101D6DB7|nr:phosphotransferase [Promicromonospora panici]
MSNALVGISPAPVEVPPVVRALAERLRTGTTVVPVWRNEYGGLTVRLEDRRPGIDPIREPALQPGRVPARRPAQLTNPRAYSGGRRSARRRSHSAYLKWVPHGAPCPDLLAEADRLVWAGSFTPVPRVLGAGRDGHGSWMLTAAVEVGGAVATSAIEPQWRSRAERSAIAVGIGLRRFHDALPTDTCPFVRTAETRVAALTAQPIGAQPVTARSITAPPPVDRLVVCHGDATVPNTLLDHVGRFAAHVDVGDLGVADRWSDIAVTTRSVTRRYGPGLEPLVLAAYGVAPDRERTAYYRALWDAEEAARARPGVPR